MIPTLLNKMVSDESMKSILLTVFKESDLNIESKPKILYDANAYVYDKYYQYFVDYITLNENGIGNYQSNMNVRTYEESFYNAKVKRGSQSPDYHHAVTLI